MSAALEARAELLKLARTLRVEPARLDFLAEAGAPDLRELRLRISDALFAADRARFERVASLGNRLPAGLVAQLAEHALGPALSAHAATLLAPKKGAELAERLHPPFLADVAAHSDVRRLAPLLEHLSPDHIAAVTRELVAREEWVTMGAFVGFLDDPGLSAALAVLEGEPLVRTGFVMEAKERMDHVVERLTDAQLADLLSATARHALWPEAFALLAHVRRERPRVAAALDVLGDDDLAALRAAVDADPLVAEAGRPLLEDASARVRGALGV